MGFGLIEDAAQAHGATGHGQTVGSLSNLATYSFYPTKNMTTGEGGMVTGRDPDLIERVRLLRNHGMDTPLSPRPSRYECTDDRHCGSNWRMQLKKLAGWNERRRQIASIYDLHLAADVDVPKVTAGIDHVYHQYTIRSPRRADLIASCEQSGVGYGIYYPIPCHRQPSFAQYAGTETLAKTDRAADEVLSLPIRPDLTDNEIECVIAAITKGAKT